MSDPLKTNRLSSDRPVTCPHCGRLYSLRERRCPECGKSLAAALAPLVDTVERAQPLTLQAISAPGNTIEAQPHVMLHFLPSGPDIPLVPWTSLVLGREGGVFAAQDVFDLTALQAGKLGVSRCHCLLLQRDCEVIVMDLGSTNGTYLNDLRLAPHRIHTMDHGDRLTIGGLHLIVFIRSKLSK